MHFIKSKPYKVLDDENRCFSYYGIFYTMLQCKEMKMNCSDMHVSPWDVHIPRALGSSPIPTLIQLPAEAHLGRQQLRAWILATQVRK